MAKVRQEKVKIRRKYLVNHRSLVILDFFGGTIPSVSGLLPKGEWGVGVYRKFVARRRLKIFNLRGRAVCNRPHMQDI